MGSNGVERLPGYRASMRQIRRQAADMRRIYARLGVEWLAEHYGSEVEGPISASILEAVGKAGILRPGRDGGRNDSSPVARRV